MLIFVIEGKTTIYNIFPLPDQSVLKLKYVSQQDDGSADNGSTSGEAGETKKDADEDEGSGSASGEAETAAK